MEKLNNIKFRSLMLIPPFLLMLAASFNYIIILVRAFPAAYCAALIIFHCFFLLSLSAVCVNVLFEAGLNLLHDDKATASRSLLYKTKDLLLYIRLGETGLLAGCYVLLALIINDGNIGKSFLLMLPSLAIFNLSRYFHSGRLLFINGSFIKHFGHSYHRIISYFCDENDYIHLISEDGSTVSLGVKTFDVDYKALEADFLKNGLKAGKPLPQMP